jgi:hypothetical protein
MQREKLYNLHRTAIFTGTFFVFKTNKVLRDRISTLREMVAQNLIFFENKKYRIKINCSFLNCRAFHAASFGVFSFFNKTYLIWSTRYFREGKKRRCQQTQVSCLHILRCCVRCNTIITIYRGKIIKTIYLCQ